MKLSRYIYLVLLLNFSLAGCATKMAYVNTSKTHEEIQEDRKVCEDLVDDSDFKDAGLKRNKLNQCMEEKGYKAVSEEEAEKIQGFKEVWIKPGIDLKGYESIFIDAVDITQVKVDNAHIPDTKVSDEDINKLGEEMFKRFSKALGIVVPVISSREEAAAKKALYLGLRLNTISRTNIGANVALQIAGQLAPIPFLPDSPQGTFSFEGEISDYASREKLITILGESKEDKNASLVGVESFSYWHHAHNIFDYWADHLAALLAKERGQEYKSRIRMKII
jgi:hypothetical protein